MIIDIEEQIACVAREVKLRIACYPNWVASGKMKQEVANKELNTMNEVLNTLISLRANSESNSSELYTAFVAKYFDWHKERTKVSPRMDGRQGKAMKEIIAYLSKESTNKTDEGVLASWEFILNNWSVLSEFIAKQTSVTEINKNLVEILNTIRLKHKKKNEPATEQLSALERMQQRAASTKK